MGTPETEFEFTDRYKALGIPYPDPETMCEGQCEGTGIYPHKSELSYTDEQLVAMTPMELIEYGQWLSVHFAGSCEPKHNPCDGYHFIRCMECGGTGKRTENVLT